MFRTVLLSLATATALFGGLLDFRTLEKAKEAYGSEEYSESAALYESIDDQNDELRYNLGDAYYKEKKYDEALKQYEQVQKSELRAKALHNMGNAYANMQKSDEAIAAYEEALKLGEDEDTRFNLELLKKHKEEQKKQEQKEKDQKNDQEKEDQKKEDEQKSKDDKQSDSKSEQEKKDGEKGDSKEDQEKKEQQEKEQKEKEQQAKADEEKKEDKSEEEQGEMKQGEAKEEPISDMQERKYEKMLDKRGIKTLMVPLKTEGAPHEETTAW